MEFVASTWLCGMLFFGAIARWVAASKGHESPGWFFLGAMLPIIGVPAAILVGPVRRCPLCDESVRSLALVCRHCGRDMPVDEEDAAAMGVETVASVR